EVFQPFKASKHHLQETRWQTQKHGRGRQEEVTSRRRACTMLLLELGIWIIPFTLVLAPCRRLVFLVSRIQGFRECVLRSRSTSPAIWSRLARLNTMTFVI
ncbi:unnamed protein product, partial [Musa acuminata subsp. burmannicoides]